MCCRRMGLGDTTLTLIQLPDTFGFVILSRYCSGFVRATVSLLPTAQCTVRPLRGEGSPRSTEEDDPSRRPIPCHEADLGPAWTCAAQQACAVAAESLLVAVSLRLQVELIGIVVVTEQLAIAPPVDGLVHLLPGLLGAKLPF